MRRYPPKMHGGTEIMNVVDKYGGFQHPFGENQSSDS